MVLLRKTSLHNCARVVLSVTIVSLRMRATSHLDYSSVLYAVSITLREGIILLRHATCY